LYRYAAAAKYGVNDFWQLNEQFIPYPWMEFVHPKNGQLYFYNFKVGLYSFWESVHPEIESVMAW
jgi:hypothetical protein